MMFYFGGVCFSDGKEKKVNVFKKKKKSNRNGSQTNLWNFCILNSSVIPETTLFGQYLYVQSAAELERMMLFVSRHKVFLPCCFCGVRERIFTTILTSLDIATEVSNFLLIGHTIKGSS